MGNNEIYNQIVSQRGRFENLVAKIPGFRGYHEMNARREADQQIRAYVAKEIEQCLTKFKRIEGKILDAGGMKHMARTREVKSKLQMYLDKVTTANPGYSGMFAQVKIGKDELDRIYAFDEAQIGEEGHLLARILRQRAAVHRPGHALVDAFVERSIMQLNCGLYFWNICSIRLPSIKSNSRFKLRIVYCELIHESSSPAKTHAPKFSIAIFAG